MQILLYILHTCVCQYIYLSCKIWKIYNLHQIDIFCTLAYHSFCSLISSHLLLYPFWYLWLSALHYAVDLTKKFCIQKLVYAIAPNECNSYYTAKWYLRNLWTREVTENGLFLKQYFGVIKFGTGWRNPTNSILINSNSVVGR